MAAVRSNKKTFWLAGLALMIGLVLGGLAGASWRQISRRVCLSINQLMNVGADSSTGESSSPWLLRIPVKYQPKYVLQTQPAGQHKRIKQVGEAELQVPVSEVALVLVDTWGGPNEPAEPTGVKKRIQALLNECRAHGVTIIHAPNFPIVNRYPAYHALDKQVTEYIQDHGGLADTDSLPFMRWPAENNKLWQQAMAIRRAGRQVALPGTQPKRMDISRHLRPAPGEYVLATYPQFRYVLWKRKIKLLLYVGGALNECMLHRDTGLNYLAGMDSGRVPMTLVVVSDCSMAMDGPEVDAEAAKKVMLDYYQHKLAFVTDSKALKFVPAK